jgi:hypothetical protein
MAIIHLRSNVNLQVHRRHLETVSGGVRMCKMLLRKKSATIICSANGSSAPTATASLHVSLASSKYKPHRLTNWLPHIQCLKACRSPIRFTPRSLLLDIMEESNNISQATAITFSLQFLKNLVAVRDARGAPSDKRGMNKRDSLNSQRTYFCTSTLPNVSDSIRMSNSSGFAEKASSMASTSSMPWSSG